PTEALGKGFGRAVAGFGPTFQTTVVVGAPVVDRPYAAATSPGRVYLIMIFAPPVVLDSPAPIAQGHFGSAVTAAGNSVVVVGAPRHRGDAVESAGIVYRFNSDGTALQPIKNPSPA